MPPRSNFHNYTVGKPFNDRTVKRYMIRLEVKDPQVYGEIEWISVQIHGQSFMLHQIVSRWTGYQGVVMGLHRFWYAADGVRSAK
jgi:hypothetical protein